MQPEALQKFTLSTLNTVTHFIITMEAIRRAHALSGPRLRPILTPSPSTGHIPAHEHLVWDDKNPSELRAAGVRWNRAGGGSRLSTGAEVAQRALLLSRNARKVAGVAAAGGARLLRVREGEGGAIGGPEAVDVEFCRHRRAELIMLVAATQGVIALAGDAQRAPPTRLHLLEGQRLVGLFAALDKHRVIFK